MTALEFAIDFVLAHEGGEANDPDDPGLITRFGISLRFLRSAGYDLGDIDGDGDIDADDIRLLTKQDAADIYQERFWKSLKLNFLPTRLAVVTMDTAVNMGPGIMTPESEVTTTVPSAASTTTPLTESGTYLFLL